MAFDGAFLHCVCSEISNLVLGSRIDKVYQPARDEVVLAIRGAGKNLKLLISADAAYARIHFTQKELDNPARPPMFCMLLRKHIGNAKIISIEQQGLERVVKIGLETRNEFGDITVMTLVAEIMGRHSNIILVNEKGKVVDAVKRVDDTVSSLRRILPGITYEAAPGQNKMSVLDCEPEEIAEHLTGFSEMPLSKALLSTLEGVSPLLCREISYAVTKDRDTSVSSLGEEERAKLVFSLRRFKDSLFAVPAPTMVLDRDRKPTEFYYTDIHQYSNAAVTKRYDNLSELLDDYYAQKDVASRIKQKAHDLIRFLINTSDKISRKLESQQKELSESADRDVLRMYGDIINANLYRLQKGDRYAELENFYDEACQTVKIKLDPMLTPSQNAQKYYKEYRKADTAEKMLTSQIEKGEKELLYIDSVFDSLTRASGEAEIGAIRAELEENGYLRPNKNSKQKPPKLSYLKYKSSDGFTIICGRNNIQNDRLSHKESAKNDMWLHTQKVPGSHTVIVGESADRFPDRTIEEAAMIAAYNSKARNSSKVAVDYTLIKNIKKPNGAKPGFVVYDTYNTVLVTPDEHIVNSLLDK